MEFHYNKMGFHNPTQYGINLIHSTNEAGFLNDIIYQKRIINKNNSNRYYANEKPRITEQ